MAKKVHLFLQKFPCELSTNECTFLSLLNPRTGSSQRHPASKGAAILSETNSAVREVGVTRTSVPDHSKENKNDIMDNVWITTSWIFTAGERLPGFQFITSQN